MNNADFQALHPSRYPLGFKNQLHDGKYFEKQYNNDQKELFRGPDIENTPLKTKMW